MTDIEKTALNELKLLEKQAKAGDREAMLDFIDFWADPGNEMELSGERLSQIEGFLKKLIDDGDPEAMFQYGMMFYNGRGVKQDYLRAMKYYRMAADAGNPDAMLELGYCYYHGREVPVNFSLAFQYFSQAALLGKLPEAYYLLGDMYLKGEFVVKDINLAEDLYRKSYRRWKKTGKDDDNPLGAEICFRLGESFFRDGDSGSEPLEAMKFFQKAEYWCYQQIFDGDVDADELLEKIEKRIEDCRDHLRME